ncbi:MAG: hypothetical protein LBN93_01270 [Candidatus Symbiothrix sp.]|jgi:hypothetical protein|nr:hypothetical protein [Candidatus Symbiothrix sp.]
MKKSYYILLLFLGFFGSGCKTFVTQQTFGNAPQLTEFTLSNTVKLATPTLDESSGLEYSKGKLWTLNDSGNGPQLFSVNPATGAVLQTITLEGATNVDWEDLAADDHYLYIADTGNNVSGARTDLKIYKLKLDDIPMRGDATIPAHNIEVIPFFYPEQGESPTPTAIQNNTAYDCEAIYVRNDTIHLFTKDWTSAYDGYGTSEYLLPNVSRAGNGKYPAIFFKRYDHINCMVTGVDYSDKINEVIVIGYQNGGLWTHYVRIYSGFQGNDLLTGSVYSKNLGSLNQVEAICFGNNPYTGYISNEKVAVIKSVSIPASLKSFTVSYKK